MNKDGYLIVNEVVGYKQEVLEHLSIDLYNKDICICGRIDIDDDIVANYIAQDAYEEGLQVIQKNKNL